MSLNLTSPQFRETEIGDKNNLTVSIFGSRSRHLYRSPERSPKSSITHFILENFCAYQRSVPPEDFLAVTEEDQQRFLKAVSALY
jgi:hypothetical protein